MKYDLKKVFENFKIEGSFVSSKPYGSGHINDTFKTRSVLNNKNVNYIFQRINHNIFKQPELLMDNIWRVTEHQQSKLIGKSDADRYAMTLILSNENKPFYIDENGNYWRCYIFIENATTYDMIETENQAYQAAKAFGDFQKALVDIPGERLSETIPDFHNTQKRFKDFEEALEKDEFNRAKFAEKEINFAMEHKDFVNILLDLCKDGKIPERITHNDTKLNNVMLDDSTGEGICVIDLDTVMPGLALYDFGDLVRTSTSPVGEDEKDLSKVYMQMNMFEALVKGYLDSARDFLTDTEIEYLPFSGKLITFETGIRFLTDYLSGDKYFKTHRDNHNLDRCKTQFKLIQSIEEQYEDMKKLVY